VECDLRWPNDLLLNGKKLAGILVHGGEGSDGALIAGIGVNINQPEFPAELKYVATSLYIETKREFSKDEMLERLVAESLRYADLLVQHGKQPVLEAFERRSGYARGKAVEVKGAGRKIKGVTEGLDENGYLRVRTQEGMETIIAGGVRAV